MLYNEFDLKDLQKEIDRYSEELISLKLKKSVLVRERKIALQLGKNSATRFQIGEITKLDEDIKKLSELIKNLNLKKNVIKDYLEAEKSLKDGSRSL